MKVDYIALSIPIFFLLIGLELLYGVIKKVKLYRLNDSITNISLGIGQQVTGVFMKTALFFGYVFLYENFRFLTIESSIINWMLLFIGVDFFYYWFHRMSHEINAMWAAHIVHHQSEDYNLSVALRQSWFQSAFSWIFYLPLALAGFDPIMFLTLSSFNTLYQFWIHTKVIKNMGVFELVFNTPSHHRVHHGSDEKYLDKNHGGTLIIWDRMFGTFQKEESEPNYGITNSLKSWNPLWANFHYWLFLFHEASKENNFLNKVRIFIIPPGHTFKNIEHSNKLIKPEATKNNKYDAKAGKAIHIYIFFHFAIVLLMATLMLFLQNDFNAIQLIFIAGFIIFSLANFGGLFEMKNWMMKAELTRLIVLPAGALLFTGSLYFNIILSVALIIAVISIAACQIYLRRSHNYIPTRTI